MKEALKGTNFDPLTIEAEPEDTLDNIVASCKNLRENIAVDASQKQIMDKAARLKR